LKDLVIYTVLRNNAGYYHLYLFVSKYAFDSL